MKRTIIIAAIAVALCSCQKETASVKSSGEINIVLNGGVDVDKDITKVSYIKDTDKYAFTWDAGDSISVFVADGTNNNTNKSFKVKTPGATSSLTGKVTPWEGQKNLYAIYPYIFYVNPSSGKRTNFSYKIIGGEDNATAKLRVFRSYQNITVGENKAETSLLVATAPNSTAVSEEEYSIGDLYFVQLMSMLRMNITDVPAGYKVTSVSFTTDADLFTLTTDFCISDPDSSTPVKTTSEITSLVTGATTGTDTKLNFSLLPTDLTGHQVTVSVLLKGESDSKLVLISKNGINFISNTVYTLNVSAASGYNLPANGPSVSYGNSSYDTRIARDGNVWFTKNLHYVPAGKHPSDVLSEINNGLWYPVNLTGKVFDTSSAAVSANGYLYNAETAFGLEPGTLNPTNYDTYEGTQGICPEGWHIPTSGDIMGLAGKCNSHTNFVDAPYFNGSSSVMSLANADGLNIANVGQVSVANLSKTSGTILNTMSQLLGSSPNTTEMGFTSMFSKGIFNNLQYFGFQAQDNTGAFNGGNANFRSGNPVRCVRKAIPADFE